MSTYSIVSTPLIFTNQIDNITSTVTSGGVLTLTTLSTKSQYFVGSANHTVVLPVATTLVTGQSFYIKNDSTGSIVVNTSGGNLLNTVAASEDVTCTCINPAGGTGTASWSTDSAVVAGDVIGPRSANSVIKISGPNGSATGLNISSTAGSNGNIYFGYSGSLPGSTGNIGIGFETLNVTSGFSNVAIGVQALRANTTGNTNTAVGSSALLSNTIGSRNTALGSGTLANSVGADFNTAVGWNASSQSSSGASNTSVGHRALTNNVAGFGNTAVGDLAMQGVVGNSPTQCTALGRSALGAITTGTNNVGIGFNAGNAITTGGTNCIFGAGAAPNLQTGSGNIIIGANSDTSASVQNSIAIGNGARVASTDNIIFGRNAGNTIMTGIGNLAIGSGALGAILSGQEVIAIGNGSCNNVFRGSTNIAVGKDTLRYCNVDQNIAVGFNALTNCGNVSYVVGTASIAVSGTIVGVGTTWRSDMVGGVLVFSTGQIVPLTAFVSTTQFTTTFIGTVPSTTYAIYYGSTSTVGTVSQSGQVVTGVGTSFFQTFIGGFLIYDTPQTNTVVQITGFTSSTSITVNASQTVVAGTTYRIYFMQPLGNTAVGFRALENNVSGGTNTAMGIGTLFANTTGQFNSGFGSTVLGNNTTGFNNTAVGSAALNANRDGICNVAVGMSALLNVQNGSNNVAVGFGALQGFPSLSGSNNTAVGDSAGGNITTGSNNTCIGNGAQASSAVVNNEITIGGPGAAVIRIPAGLVSRGSAPSATCGVGAGAVPPVPSIAGTDFGCSVSFTTTAGAVTGAVLNVTFAVPFAAPATGIIVTFSPRSADAAGVQLYVSAVSLTGFTLSSIAPLASSLALSYHIRVSAY